MEWRGETEGRESLKERNSGRAEGAECLENKRMKARGGEGGIVANLLSDQTGGGAKGRRREVEIGG